ncbi:RIB-2 protein [Aphelenchoides avenae]|nr:RIB-2 protein [Aphelenchus avenae]
MRACFKVLLIAGFASIGTLFLLSGTDRQETPSSTPPLRRKGQIVKLPVLKKTERQQYYDAAVLNCSYTWEQCEAKGRPPIHTSPAPGQNFTFPSAYKTPAEDGFTIVLVIYNRDGKLKLLDKFEGLPFLKAVIVIWNDWTRALPSNVSTKLHVPVYYVNGTYNSLNNRFLPLDLIKTEAVLSLDDDIPIALNDILYSYKVWQDHNYAIVGPFSRLLSLRNGRGSYNPGPRCAYNAVITGAAFMHRAYLHAYTYEMPAAIREHVDEVMNCEDIAMNFLVANMTGSAMIRTTKSTQDDIHPKPSTTAKPATATSPLPTSSRTPSSQEPAKVRAKRSLSDRAGHYRTRDKCVERFALVYGRNPLVTTSYYAPISC